MLSASGLSAGHAASGYYRSEGYYIAGSPEGEKSSEYFGKAAKEEGLMGAVQDEQFTALIEGKAPNGQLLGRIRDGERQHLPGVDLTFSAPKGVSIVALVAGDAAVFGAHKEAVKEAMSFVENNVAQFRTSKDGLTEVHTGGKLIAGMFHHDTSRALQNRELFNNKMVVGQIYRNALANNLERLGFEIEHQKDGLLDIKGIPAELTDAFSKRRAEIEASLKDRGLSPDAKNSALAALATRATKKPVERAELTEAWHAEVNALGIYPKALVVDLRNREHNPETKKFGSDQNITHRSLDFAISHLRETKSVYAHKDVMLAALRYDTTVSPEGLLRELSQLGLEKVIYPVMRGGALHYTDQEHLRLETENVGMMRAANTRGGGVDVRRTFEKLKQIGNDAALAHRLKDSTLSDGQKEAVQLSLSSNAGRIVGVQGLAGTGKTYMMSTVEKIATSRGYSIEGLAPSKVAVGELAKAIPDTRTLEGALTRFGHRGHDGEDRSKKILVVDEASMLSTENMNRVLRMTEVMGYARVVLMGDVKQLDAVGAGAAFRLLQERGLPLANMADVQRQNTTEGRNAVIASYHGEIKTAMEAIASTTEVGVQDSKRSAIATALAERYASRSDAERKGTGEVVMTNAMRSEVTSSVQEILLREGKLSGPSQTLDTLEPRNLSGAQASESRSYQMGDVVISPVPHKSSGLLANVPYSVTAIDIKEERVTLSGPDGNAVDLNLKPGMRLSQKLAVFTHGEATFHTGDQLKFRINDNERSVVNGLRGEVEKISADSMSVRTEAGELKTFPTVSLAAQGAQLSYASTAHDFQGKSIDNVLLGMVSDEQLSTQKAFYVGLSRMRDETHLVTDDAALLIAKIEQATGERINALDVVDPEKDRREYGAKVERLPDKKEAENGHDITSEKQRPVTEMEPDKDGQKENDKSDADWSKIDRQLDMLDQLQNKLDEHNAKQFQRDQKTR